MKKTILVILVILLIIFFVVIKPVYCFVEHTAPDGFMSFVHVKDINTINLWVGNFRYPTELMVMELTDKRILSLKTFTFKDNTFTDFENQFVMFETFVNTSGFFIDFKNKTLKIQNNYTGNIYKYTWLGSWYFTMAVWQFTYWDSWLGEGYKYTDGMGKQAIFITPRDDDYVF